METKAATDATASTETKPTEPSDGLTDEQRKQRDRLQAEHPGKELRLAEHPFGHWMIFRIPTEPEYRIYKAKSASDKPNDKDEAKDVMLGCILFPAKDALKKEIEGRPALRDHWASEVVEGAGVNAGVKQKKL